MPPRLPEGAPSVSLRTAEFLKPPDDLRPEVKIAATPPTVDFSYYPEQTYPGRPWSVWGDGTAAGGKYYSAIGDHKAPDGNAFVYEYDPAAKSLRTLLSLRDVIDVPEGHYRPGKIHSRIDLGEDGWLYFATHRGSTRVTTDEYYYQGDWIVRHHPSKNVSEIVAHGPVGNQCIPVSVLDPTRGIFYGGTAAGDVNDKRVTFFAYDVKNKRLLHSCLDGPYRYVAFAKSTGRVYFSASDDQPLRRWDPAAVGEPVTLDVKLGLRAATEETPQGIIYTVSKDGVLFAFDVKTETATELGDAAVGRQTYVTTLDADPSGRFLYYCPGAHGGSEQDGTPIVQFDVRDRTKQVIAFLHPVLKQRVGYVPIGTFSSAVDPAGDKLYFTWNGSRGEPDRRGRYDFETCALTVIYVAEEER